MTWAMVSVVVAALAVFGVWMKHLVDAIGAAQSSELKRIEQKVDLLNENQQQNHDNAMKTLDARFQLVHNDLAVYDRVLEDRFTALGRRLDKHED